ncbi:MAG: TauD/TfdA family dioxygenase [Novosphingobium sp.]|nr:TauD/TfdA family dioxygenase [Novosphingobium sp.]
MYDLSQYEKIRVEPLTASTGAEIFDVDIAHIDDEIFAEIKHAFHEHTVIFFRDQNLDADSLGAFAERFAPLVTTYAREGEAPNPVGRMHRAADTPTSVRNLGDRWHADQSSREAPNMGVALYCLEAPRYGGDTLFANLCAAYEGLAPGLKAMCEPLIALHSLAGIYGTDGRGGVGTTKPFSYEAEHVRLDDEMLEQIRKRIEHPLICSHPESGKPILYVTGNHMVGIKDMNDLEAAPLLQLLNNHVVRPRFTCRFRWKKGSLAVWDNRCTQHFAVNDYAGFARTMLRAEMAGTRPIGLAMPGDTADPKPLKAAS